MCGNPLFWALSWVVHSLLFSPPNSWSSVALQAILVNPDHLVSTLSRPSQDPKPALIDRVHWVTWHSYMPCSECSPSLENLSCLANLWGEMLFPPRPLPSEKLPDSPQSLLLFLSSHLFPHQHTRWLSPQRPTLSACSRLASEPIHLLSRALSPPSSSFQCWMHSELLHSQLSTQDSILWLTHLPFNFKHSLHGFSTYLLPAYVFFFLWFWKGSICYVLQTALYFKCFSCLHLLSARIKGVHHPFLKIS